MLCCSPRSPGRSHRKPHGESTWERVQRWITQPRHYRPLGRNCPTAMGSMGEVSPDAATTGPEIRGSPGQVPLALAIRHLEPPSPRQVHLGLATSECPAQLLLSVLPPHCVRGGGGGRREVRVLSEVPSGQEWEAVPCHTPTHDRAFRQCPVILHGPRAISCPPGGEACNRATYTSAAQGHLGKKQHQLWSGRASHFRPASVHCPRRAAPRTLTWNWPWGLCAVCL